jgi:hypothetical protein
MTDDVSTPEGADPNPENLDSRRIPHPGHSLETAKRCIHKSCDPDEHDWVELTGFSEPAYWARPARTSPGNIERVKMTDLYCLACDRPAVAAVGGRHKGLAAQPLFERVRISSYDTETFRAGQLGGRRHAEPDRGRSLVRA